METLLNKIDSYNFECEAGPLKNCVDWMKLRAALAHSAANDKAGVEVPSELDVRKIMIDIVPGPDGEGVEVYAKTVADIERLLSDMGQRLEDCAGNTHPQPQAAQPAERVAQIIAAVEECPLHVKLKVLDALNGITAKDQS